MVFCKRLLVLLPAPQCSACGSFGKFKGAATEQYGTVSSEPGAACRTPFFPNFLGVVLILRSIFGPLKRKLMAFSCHILLSSVPPRCVLLWRSPEMNFTRHPRVTKLFCIGSPLNRSQGRTYCTTVSQSMSCKSIL